MGDEKLEHTNLHTNDDKIDPDHAVGVKMSRDEYTLAKLGYRQVFVRSFGLFENARYIETSG